MKKVERVYKKMGSVECLYSEESNSATVFKISSEPNAMYLCTKPRFLDILVEQGWEQIN